jgi:hypothetical protein
LWNVYDGKEACDSFVALFLILQDFLAHLRDLRGGNLREKIPAIKNKIS